jgi:hypothetical protein
MSNEPKRPAVAGRIDQPVRPLEARAWLCEWDGWRQTHLNDEDPLPDKWDDEPPKVTTLYALADDELAAVNNLRAQKARALQVNMKRCQCDHNEYCRHCWPEDFRPGGVWHGLGA